MSKLLTIGLFIPRVIKKVFWNRLTKFVIKWSVKGSLKVLRFLVVQLEALLMILDV